MKRNTIILTLYAAIYRYRQPILGDNVLTLLSIKLMWFIFPFANIYDRLRDRSQLCGWHICLLAGRIISSVTVIFIHLNSLRHYVIMNSSIMSKLAWCKKVPCNICFLQTHTVRISFQPFSFETIVQESVICVCGTILHKENIDGKHPLDGKANRSGGILPNVYRNFEYLCSNRTSTENTL